MRASKNAGAARTKGERMTALKATRIGSGRYRVESPDRAAASVVELDRATRTVVTVEGHEYEQGDVMAAVRDEQARIIDAQRAGR